jgi:hypothetical protein
MVICSNCEVQFYAKPSWLKNDFGKYCSRSCAHQAQKKGQLFACSTCQKQVYKSLKDQARSKSGKFFCSKSCQTVWRNARLYIGENHANWTGGESSYRQGMLASKRPLVCARCSTDDKRILAVHHKDKDRLNNRFSNLIWLCHNCHYLVHHFSDEAKCFVVPVAQWLERRSVAAETRVQFSSGTPGKKVT